MADRLYCKICKEAGQLSKSRTHHTELHKPRSHAGNEGIAREDDPGAGNGKRKRRIKNKGKGDDQSGNPPRLNAPPTGGPAGAPAGYYVVPHSQYALPIQVPHVPQPGQPQARRPQPTLQAAPPPSGQLAIQGPVFPTHYGPAYGSHTFLVQGPLRAPV